MDEFGMDEFGMNFHLPFFKHKEGWYFITEKDPNLLGISRDYEFYNALELW